MQMSVPMIPGRTTAVTRATMVTEAVAVVGRVTKTACPTMIMAAAIRPRIRQWTRLPSEWDSVSEEGAQDGCDDERGPWWPGNRILDTKHR